MTKPNFFLVGAPRCGTTAMNQYLQRHPDIFMARKEMHVFGSDLKFGPQFYRRKEPAYLREFENWSGQRAVGESSVWYLLSKRAAAELKAFNPEARIIIMLREPSEMIQSMYYQFRYDGNEHLPTLEEALAAEEDPAQGAVHRAADLFPEGMIYTNNVRYTDQVKRYFDVFGRERVKVVVYDDLAANPAATYQEVLKFLGVDPNWGEKDFKVINGCKAHVKNTAVRAIMHDRLVRLAVLKLRPLLPLSLFRAMQKLDASIRSNNTAFQNRPGMAPHLCRDLKQEFAGEVERLGALLGRDLTHWSRFDDSVRDGRKEDLKVSTKSPVLGFL